MFDRPEITVTVLVVLTALGVGIGFFSLRRRRKIRGLCLAATQAIEQGRHDDALRMLLAAERSWAFNSHEGSRSSHIADLDDFTSILRQLSRLPSGGGDTSSITRIEVLVAELRSLFSDRANFGIDGRSMKRDAAARWSEMSGRFQTLREELRKSYESPRVAV
jgi:hypothetical protein